MSLLDDVLAIPDHLSDALWRVDSARLDAADSAGLLVCGMGGSAIGADLAAAALAERLTRPLLTVRGYRLPAWAGADWTVLCSSYSGGTEETLSCFDAAGTLGARRIVVGTGGALVDRAREDGVPVVGLPGILQPRAAVAYMFVAAAEAAALAGAAPRIAAEVEAAAGFLREESAALRERAAAIAAGLEGALPVIYGAELTAPVARRWKTQVNENAKLQAFFSELPEADHNEILRLGRVARRRRPGGRPARGPRVGEPPRSAPLRAHREGDRRRRSRRRPGARRGRQPHRPHALDGDARRPRLARAGLGQRG